MEQLTFTECLERGIREIVIDSYGYEEGRVMPIWQPFKHKRAIPFRVYIDFNDLGDSVIFNQTFFLKESEWGLDYILQDDGTVHVDDPLIGADIDY